jgi:hypothetical protein
MALTNSPLAQADDRQTDRGTQQGTAASCCDVWCAVRTRDAYYTGRNQSELLVGHTSSVVGWPSAKYRLWCVSERATLDRICMPDHPHTARHGHTDISGELTQQQRGRCCEHLCWSLPRSSACRRAPCSAEDSMRADHRRCTTTTSNTTRSTPPLYCSVMHVCIGVRSCRARVNSCAVFAIARIATLADAKHALCRHYLRRMGTDGVHGSPDSPPGSDVLSSSLPSPTTSREDAADATRHAHIPVFSASDTGLVADTDGLNACAARPVTARGRVEQQGPRLGVGVRVTRTPRLRSRKEPSCTRHARLECS